MRVCPRQGLTDNALFVGRPRGSHWRCKDVTRISPRRLGAHFRCSLQCILVVCVYLGAALAILVQDLLPPTPRMS